MADGAHDPLIDGARLFYTRGVLAFIKHLQHTKGSDEHKNDESMVEMRLGL